MKLPTRHASVSTHFGRFLLPVLTGILFFGLVLAAGCTSPPSQAEQQPEIPVSGTVADIPENCTLFHRSETGTGYFSAADSCYFAWHSPLDFLDDLKTQPEGIVSVLEVPPGWITAQDAAALMQRIDSAEPAAPVVSLLSSYMPFNQSSTVGNEAMFLLEGYRTGRYPPALCSLYYFQGNTTEMKTWWENYGRKGVLESRTAITLVKNQNRDLWDYPREEFPDRSVLTERTATGWYLAFIQHGSGVPITSAYCYYVDDNRTVRETGVVNRSIMVMDRDFSVQRCGG